MRNRIVQLACELARVGTIKDSRESTEDMLFTCDPQLVGATVVVLDSYTLSSRFNV